MANFISKQLTFSSCKTLATIRLGEANILFSNKKYSGAYYLAGYAIELGIKAYYCKGRKRYTFPPDPSVVKSLYTHDLNGLMTVSELKRAFDIDVSSDSSLQSNWETVKDWSEKSRYSRIKKSDSESMINAVKVIFTWMQTKWN
jgi:HEPN domain-containing protein